MGQTVRLLLLTVSCCLVADLSQAQQPSALSETYGSWTYQCKALEASQTEAGRACQVSQELRQSQTGSRILSAAYTSEKLTIIAPFGVKLREGVKAMAGEHELPIGSFTTCLPSIGCIAELDLGAEGLSRLLSAETLGVRLVSAAGQQIQVNLSLDGFQSAYKRLNANGPAQE